MEIPHLIVITGDPPWLTSQLKTPINRKHRVYRRYIERGKNHDDGVMLKPFVMQQLGW